MRCTRTAKIAMDMVVHPPRSRFRWGKIEKTLNLCQSCESAKIWNFLHPRTTKVFNPKFNNAIPIKPQPHILEYWNLQRMGRLYELPKVSRLLCHSEALCQTFSLQIAHPLLDTSCDITVSHSFMWLVVQLWWGLDSYWNVPHPQPHHFYNRSSILMLCNHSYCQALYLLQGLNCQKSGYLLNLQNRVLKVLHLQK